MHRPGHEPSSRKRKVDETPIVELSGVTVRRGGKDLIAGIDWSIRTDERWVLFGANGSGKTTLMEVIATYLGPTSGKVRVLGGRRGKVDLRELRTRIGYVGPGPATYVRQHFLCRDIVVTGKHASFVATRWHTYSDGDWAFADECLALMGASHLAEREFVDLSEGEKKRVLIARSLMTRPELLLLDEPGSGLDLGARERLVASLAAYAHDPAAPAAVLVTHHVEEIPPGFDHILMLAHGRVVACGKLAETLSAESLSEVYEMDLRLESTGERYRAWSPG